MEPSQHQLGDIEELTPAGVKAIQQESNVYTESSRPVFAHERDWGTWNMTALWVGILVSIAVYQVGSGLIVAGMSWYQALFTIVLGHTLVMVFAVVLGHFGTRFGIGYPMLSRLIFGPKGVIVPAIVRGVLGCFWFGVQGWIGGQAVNAIIEVFFPAWKAMGFNGLFISFLIFWAMNVYIAASGSKAVKALETYSAPGLIGLSLVVILWGLSNTNWSMTQLLSHPSMQGNPDVSFWKLFFPALSAMIAFDGGIALSMADFTKHCKNQKAQFVGQIAGAPLMTCYIAFVGICGTAGAAVVFNESIWEPAILVSRFAHPAIVVFFSLFIIMAVLTTNVAGNLVPPTNLLANLFPKKLSYKAAAMASALLALCFQPWNALSSAYVLIFEVCGILGAMLGPISGLYLVAYIWEHKGRVSLVDLYRSDAGRYNYSNGWNLTIIGIFLGVTAVVLSGRYIPAMRVFFDNSYVLGSLLSGGIYYIYLRMTTATRATNKEM